MIGRSKELVRFELVFFSDIGEDSKGEYFELKARVWWKGFVGCLE